ncbi:hypothetical protein [Streptomyces sp. NBC_00233]|uniref:hypothetical protein n=1 Tax=Streptomyces sp. NBC_00233 TaxID=2975686 RepID=UPI002250FE10|nr:hypothetical protein [Streptomyces sp. NBC_00233]MCX5225803.1 hypothetical protein [Streptomyces sp. NBC_00233]
MSTKDLVPSPVGPVDVEQAEAALVERYPRLVRIAYLVLPPSLGRNRRVLTAHALVQRSLPRRRVAGPAVPEQRLAEDAVDPGYAYVRGEVLRQALVAGLPLRRLALPRRAQFPPLLPHVWGLRLFPRVGGADELALDQRLSRLSGPGRAAYVLRGLERQGDAEVLRVLAAAGVEDPTSALAEADALEDEPEAPGDGPGGTPPPPGGPTGARSDAGAGSANRVGAAGTGPYGRSDRVGEQPGPGRGAALGARGDRRGPEAAGRADLTGHGDAGRRTGAPTGPDGPTGPGGADRAESGPDVARDVGGRTGAGTGPGTVGGPTGRDAGPAAGERPPAVPPARHGFDPGRRRSGAALLESDEFDPCALQARPTDLLRRRQHARAGIVAVAALLVCGALLGLPGDGWGRNGAAAPSYARNPAAEAALDPAALKRVGPAVWPGSTRQDFSVWPARGALTGDRALLRRALAVWARPGASVRSSATPGTPVGPPMGPPQLLFAGVVDGARVVLLHDGLRVVRYAEPVGGTAGAALDFARTDGADTVGSAALVLSRAAGNVRYLTAPWVKETAVRDLLAPGEGARPLGRDAGGVTEPMTSPALAKGCTRWNTLQVRDGSGLRMLADLGELAPARLLWGPPGAPADATNPEAREAWARTACQLSAVRAHGVRSVNAWRFARQSLPEGAGRGTWLCTRAETWRGTGSRVLAQFLVPSPTVPAALAARSEGSPACGVRDPRVLAGVLWQAPGGGWYVLAAGSPEFTALETSGGVKGRSDGPLLAVKAAAGARADLDGTLPDGTRVRALR